MQLLAQELGGHVAHTSGRREYGPATIEVAAEAAGNPQVFRIFAGVDGPAGGTEQAQTGAPLCLRVWMSHGGSVPELPGGFRELARPENSPVGAMANAEGMGGLQVPPEVTHTP